MAENTVTENTSKTPTKNREQRPFAKLIRIIHQSTKISQYGVVQFEYRCLFVHVNLQLRYRNSFVILTKIYDS